MLSSLQNVLAGNERLPKEFLACCEPRQGRLLQFGSRHRRTKVDLQRAILRSKSEIPAVSNDNARGFDRECSGGETGPYWIRQRRCVGHSGTDGQNLKATQEWETRVLKQREQECWSNRRKSVLEQETGLNAMVSCMLRVFSSLGMRLRASVHKGLPGKRRGRAFLKKCFELMPHVPSSFSQSDLWWVTPLLLLKALYSGKKNP